MTSSTLRCGVEGDDCNVCCSQHGEIEKCTTFASYSPNNVDCLSGKACSSLSPCECQMSPRVCRSGSGLDSSQWLLEITYDGTFSRELKATECELCPDRTMLTADLTPLLYPHMSFEMQLVEPIFEAGSVSSSDYFRHVRRVASHYRDCR